MRIARLRVGAYGGLAGWEAELGDVTVVLGPNEAGKSTLRDVVTTLLFGFQPASRERHPYLPWDRDRLELEAELRLDRGARVVAARRMMSTIRGVLAEDGGPEQNLANRPLPWAGALRREVYRSVFTLGVADLRMFEEDAWQTLEDRLLGGGDATGLRRPSAVAKELEDEAAALWRPDRRGKPRAAELAEEIRSLEERLTAARRADDRRHEAEAELAQLASARAELERRLRETAARRERLERLQEAAEQLDELERRRARAGDVARLEALPADPAERWRELEAALGALDARLAALRGRLREAEARAQLPGADAAILAQEAELSAALERARPIAAERERLAELEGRARAEEARLRHVAAEVLAGPWTDEAAAALERLSPAELAERARRAERAAEERRAREQEVRALRRALEAAGAEVPEGAVVGDATAGVDAGVPPAAPAAPRAATLAAAAAAAAGLAGLAGAALALAGHSWGWGLAAGAGVAAALLAWRAHAAAVAAAAAAAREAALAAAAEAAREAAPGVEALRAAQEALEAAQAEAAAAAEAVREALGGLPVAPAFAEAPDVELAQRVRELRRYWEALRDLQEEAAALRRALQAREAGVRDWARRLGMVEGVEDVDALVLARRLEDALDRARRRRREAEQAADERARLQAELRELEAQRAETVRQRDALLERLGAFGPDVEAALLEVRERRDAWQRARFLADALERRPGGLQGVRREVRAAREAGDLPWTDAERGRAAEEERALAEALKETDRRIGELRRELQELETREKAADVAGWIAARAEEREALLRRRDRLALAAALVRLGAERFRERHQPDILKRAGEHLAAFTEGRYDRLLFDEAQNVELPSGAEEARVPGAGAATALLVRRAADGELIPAAPPLSEGTLHQIHLALRLALADHLDEGGERLPACFDETFLHWSERRRRAGLRHLAAWAARRQVLLFTCHPWFAEEAQEEAGATVLRLPG